jgi:hypothetical protein
MTLTTSQTTEAPCPITLLFRWPLYTCVVQSARQLYRNLLFHVVRETQTSKYNKNTKVLVQKPKWKLVHSGA